MADNRSIRFVHSLELVDLLDWPSVIEAVAESYRQAALGGWSMAPRATFAAPEAPVSLKVLSGVSGAAGLAGVSAYSAGNPKATGVQKITMLYDLEDGSLRGIVESDRLSWMRTGATGAVASRALARPDARVLGIVGSGRQAKAQVLAHASAMPIERVVVYSRSEERRNVFVEDVRREIAVPVEAVSDVRDLLEQADIVSAITNSKQPVFDGDLVRPGTHVNALGSHDLDRREVDTRLVQRSRLFLDQVERAFDEEGEVVIPIQEGAITREHVLGTVGDVLAGLKPGRLSADNITLFTSGGIANEHLAVAALALRLAEERGAGQVLEIPRDPGLPHRPPTGANSR